MKQRSNKTLATRRATKEMKLLSQLSTVSRNAVTWGKIFALVKQGTCKKTQPAGGKDFFICANHHLTQEKC